MGRSARRTDTRHPPVAGRWVWVRYPLLFLIGLTAVAVTGLSGYASISSSRDGLAAVSAVDAVSLRHHDANAAVHTLYAHTLTVVEGGSSAPHNLLEDVAGHAARARTGLAANQDAVGRLLPPGSPLPQELNQLAQHVETFTSDAITLIRLTGTDSTAARSGLEAFTTSFTELDTEFDATANELASAAADTQTTANRRIRRATTMIVGGVAGATVLLLLLGGAVFRADIRMTRAARREAELHRFAAELHTALEMVGSEPEAYQVFTEALGERLDRTSNLSAELLLADSSKSQTVRAATTPDGGPGCQIGSPWECVAVRRGQLMMYATSQGLSACRKLRARPSGPTSAVCVPVTFMGRGLGVLHNTGDDGDVPGPDLVELLTTVADQVGHRIGTLRAFSLSELQAATDGLTGLLNRRTVEERIHDVIRANAGRPYSVAMADLDRFKVLNDAHGHDAGDQALRLFAQTLTQTLRDGDLAGRYGGEEFVLFFPRTEASEAVKVVDRLRAELASATGRGTVAPFTASFGVADSSERATFAEALVLADRRLRLAKRLGRDRTISPLDDVPTATSPGLGLGRPADPLPDGVPSPRPPAAWQYADGATDLARGDAGAGRPGASKPPGTDR